MARATIHRQAGEEARCLIDGHRDLREDGRSAAKQEHAEQSDFHQVERGEAGAVFGETK
jgi:hypothetical protein